MSICSICEALPSIKQCCDIAMCHLCISKHKCNRPEIQSISVLDVNLLYQKVISNYDSKLDSIHQLYNMLLDENKKMKQENEQLYAENQAMILEIANLKEQGTMIVESDLKKKEDLPLAPPKLIRQTNLSTTERRLTIPKSGIKPKK